MKSVKTGKKIYLYKETWFNNCSSLRMSDVPMLEYETSTSKLEFDRLEDEYKLV